MVARLEEFQRQRRVFAGTVLGAVCDYVKATNTSVARIFHQVDADGSGDLDPMELQEALRRMGQDLNELEVEEIMRELVGQSIVTSMQFMDALKQFKNEREADANKCADLFAEYDKDGSGGLDLDEVRRMTERLGIQKQMLQKKGDKSDDFLQQLVSEIEDSKQEDLSDAKAEGAVVTYLLQRMHMASECSNLPLFLAQL